MIIIHHNDLDGRCSAAIVYRYLKKYNYNNEQIKLFEMDYDKKFPIDEIEKNEHIYILDFCLEDETMLDKLIKITKNLIVIDHHQTSLEIKGLKDLDGIRDVSKAACVLTWEFFHKKEDRIPDAVEYIGDMDAWIWNEREISEPFTTALMMEPHKPKDEIWDKLIYDPLYHKHISKLIQEGKICVKFRKTISEDYMTKYGFEVDFEGKKCFACGFYAFGSMPFGYRIKKYDICISFEYNGDKFLYGLYSDNKVDVSKIAEKYKGGGHKGASGFSSKELLFKKEEQK